MSKKKIVCFLLALSLITTLLAGCAGETTEAIAPAAEVEASQSQDTSASEPQSQETSQESGQSGSITYPIANGNQPLTMWTDFQEEDYLKTQNDFPILPAVREATGIDFQFIEVSKASASEQFNLMIASGEWPDLFNPVERYSGGAEQAFQDEVIMDLTDLLPVHAPDYWAKVLELGQTDYESLLTTTNEGDEAFLYMSSINDCTYTSRGNVCRGDWLDEMGYTVEDLKTLDGFTEVLYAAYNKYEPEYTLYLGSSAALGSICAFETAIPDITNTSNLSIYLTEDGTVVSGWVSDDYREYLEWISQLYADGIVNEDFQTINWAMNETLAHIGNGDIFLWETGNDVVDDAQLYTDDANKNLRVEPLYTIYADGNEVNRFGQDESLLGFAKFAVTTTCEVPELAVEYMNFFFTDEGIMMANYGTEGESYTMGEDGEPHFTDLVLNNEVITNVQGACKHYTASYLCWYNHQMKLFDTFGGSSAHCVAVWSQGESTSDFTYPGALGLTTEESDSIINKLTDCIACGQERVLKFITGSMPLNDESWDEYVADMTMLGIQDCLDVYQVAYDEYLAGERKATGGMPMGGGPGGGPGGESEEDGEKPEPPPM